jgi:hypothetical protein
MKFSPSKFAGVAILIGGFMLLLAVVNILHFRFFPVRVVLYDTLMDVAIACGLLALVYAVYLRRVLALNGAEVVLSFAVAVLIGYNYAISIPTVIDRSLSIYILEKIAQRGGGIREDALPSVFKDEYLPEHQLVRIRLTEQLNSGTIRIDNGCVTLTDRGRTIVNATRYYRTHFLPRRREIMGELTDALTDPFRNSKPATDYTCKP